MTTCLENLEMSGNYSCQWNVGDFTKIQGSVRGKILSGKSCLKLFIVCCIFASILYFAKFLHFISVSDHALLHSYPTTDNNTSTGLIGVTLNMGCWSVANCRGNVMELSGNFTLFGEWSTCMLSAQTVTMQFCYLPNCLQTFMLLVMLAAVMLVGWQEWHLTGKRALHWFSQLSLSVVKYLLCKSQVYIVCLLVSAGLALSSERLCLWSSWCYILIFFAYILLFTF